LRVPRESCAPGMNAQVDRSIGITFIQNIPDARPVHSCSWFTGSVVTWSRQSYRVKPHGQLVLVSLTHYCASTPSLSTSWSTTTLQGAQGPGKTHLETSFPLRCFQRLSLPHLATRRCHWRDNRYTRGVSTPVLSY
jgi:hypothetical protein